jgi:hypothetical protein
VSATASNRPRIFVFGSNLLGIHGEGAALYAKQHYGAVDGIGEGLMGTCYALPTCAAPGTPLRIKAIQIYVERFRNYTLNANHNDYLVTSVGMGLAGVPHNRIGQIFSDFNWPDCVYLQGKLANAMVLAAQAEVFGTWDDFE